MTWATISWLEASHSPPLASLVAKGRFVWGLWLEADYIIRLAARFPDSRSTLACEEASKSSHCSFKARVEILHNISLFPYNGLRGEIHVQAIPEIPNNYIFVCNSYIMQVFRFPGETLAQSYRLVVEIEFHLFRLVEGGEPVWSTLQVYSPIPV